jgi:ketosteroid isomerase-like protein
MAHPNSELICQFYTAYQQGDFRTMQNCYRDDATFSDPVFQNLSSAEVKAMWEMLVTSARDLKVEFKNVTANDTAGQCQWDAWYTFSKTGRRVHNVISASFQFREGKISRHVDRFGFWRWSR